MKSQKLFKKALLTESGHCIGQIGTMYAREWQRRIIILTGLSKFLMHSKIINTNISTRATGFCKIPEVKCCKPILTREADLPSKPLLKLHYSEHEVSGKITGIRMIALY